MIVEENNALKNILKGAVIACEDGDMLDVSFTAVYRYPIYSKKSSFNH